MIPEVFWFPAGIVAGWILIGAWRLTRAIANLWHQVSR
jgi:hypothetical protein